MLAEEARLLRGGEQKAIPRRPSEAFANPGDEAITTVHQAAREQVAEHCEPGRGASEILGCVSDSLPLDEGAAILDPEQRLDLLQAVLLAQTPSERRRARDKEQIVTLLAGQDEAHKAATESAIGVKDEHGRGHGGLDEMNNPGGANGEECAPASGLLDTWRFPAFYFLHGVIRGSLRS
jgi:hypothetical protein